MLALIAGKGGLPVALAAALGASARPYRVLALEGFVPDLPEVEVFRVEDLGKVLADLRTQGITEVCFAGAMQRPPIDPARLHPLSVPLVPRLMAVLQGGDDRLLREVIAIFEDAGLEVRGAHEIAPGLLAPEGAIAGEADAQARADATRGAQILGAIGPLDIGQGCVIANGQCLGVETLQGTDALLGFVARTRGAVAPGPGGVFVKRAKPGQDLRIDMPTIGPDTIRAVAQAGLRGIALQAGHVLVLERAEVARLAGDAGIALWGMP